MIELAHYKDGDVLLLQQGKLYEQLNSSFVAGDSYTATEDGEIVFCCGIALYWKGHAETWVIIGTVNNPVEIVRRLSDLIEWAVQKHKLFRMTAHCDSSWLKANKLMEALGFIKEATLPCYGPSLEAYNVYGKVF